MEQEINDMLIRLLPIAAIGSTKTILAVLQRRCVKAMESIEAKMRVFFQDFLVPAVAIFRHAAPQFVKTKRTKVAERIKNANTHDLAPVGENRISMINEFHWTDGWYFKRLEDGSVRICSVSKCGETGDRWNQAQDFHGRPVPQPVSDPGRPVPKHGSGP